MVRCRPPPDFVIRTGVFPADALFRPHRSWVAVVFRDGVARILHGGEDEEPLDACGARYIVGCYRVGKPEAVAKIGRRPKLESACIDRG